MSDPNFKIEVDCNSRLDNFLAAKFPSVSRSKLQKIIVSGGVDVNGKHVKSSYVLHRGDNVILKKDLEPDKKFKLIPEPLTMDLLYEDDYCLVVNKKPNMVVHPDKEEIHARGTVCNEILVKLRDNFEDSYRPGVVHRLDKDTSGVLLIAKTRGSRDFFVDQFKNREIQKFYYALVCGWFSDPVGEIDAKIGRNSRDRKKMAISSDEFAKEAHTDYQVLQNYCFADSRISYLDLQPRTGRMHQLRVHLAAINHPVCADKVYGDKKMNQILEIKLGLKRQFLHSYRIVFKKYPDGRMVDVRCSLANDLQMSLDKLVA